MRRFIINLGILVCLFLITSPASAALSTYGYLIGTFIPGTNKVEPISQQGTFLHYEFQMSVNGVNHKVVIDIKNGHIKPFPYKILDMRSYNSHLYGNIFTKPAGYYPIATTGTGTSPTGVGLDFIRHEGVIRDSIGKPWKTKVAEPTSNPDIYKIPEFDSLFNGVTKLYVLDNPLLQVMVCTMCIRTRVTIATTL